MISPLFQKIFVLLYKSSKITTHYYCAIKFNYIAGVFKNNNSKPMGLNFLNHFRIFRTVTFINIVKLINRLNLKNRLLFYWRFKLSHYFNLSHKYTNSSYLKKIGLVRDENDKLLKYGWSQFSKPQSLHDFMMDFFNSQNPYRFKRGLRYKIRRLLFRHKKFFFRMIRPLRSLYYYFWQSTHLKIADDNKKKMPIKISYLVIRFFKRKNNLFVNISLPDGSILFSLTGGRFTSGKKKTSTLTAKHLARILCRLIIRYLEFLQYDEPKEYHYQRFLLTFEFNMMLHTPYIRTFFNIFKQFELPIVKLIDVIKTPHSFGSKKKKMRRV